MPKIYRRRTSSIRLDRVAFLISLLLCSIFLFVALIMQITGNKQVKKREECDTTSKIILESGSLKTLQGDARKDKTICFDFNASSQDKIILFSQRKVILKKPNNKQSIIEGSYNLDISENGTYSIIIKTNEEVEKYQLSLKRENNQLTATSSLKTVDRTSYNIRNNQLESSIAYNAIAPTLKFNSELQTIVDSVVRLAALKGMPIDKLSISLIDLKSSKCCAYGQYLDREPRFPASVTKLFWMVYLYGQYEAGLLPEGTVSYKQLAKMIQDSNNESASLIVDRATKTKSGESLLAGEIDEWIGKRLAINTFFEKAGYNQINISQKLFPTDYAKNDDPAGRDLQIRGLDESNPIRNYINTYHVARLLLEIEREESISKKYSKNMKRLLKRNLHPGAWKD